MKWTELLRKDNYALLQSESDTQYAVASSLKISSGQVEHILLIGMTQSEKLIACKML